MKVFEEMKIESDSALITRAAGIAGVICVLLLSVACDVFGDTIYFKNEGFIKGYIIKEYQDRYLVSTSHGEKEIPKAIIKDVRYYDPVKQLMKKGRDYEKSGNLKAALKCYEEIISENSENAHARERILKIKEKILRRKTYAGRASVASKDRLARWDLTKEIKEEQLLKIKSDKVKESLGLVVRKDGADIGVAHVRHYSPAYNAGLLKGDFIVCVSGQDIKYSRLIDVYDLLKGPRYTELKLDIERSITVDKGDKKFPLGALLSIGRDGLEVMRIRPNRTRKKSDSLLEPGDRIVSINGEVTRYSSLGDIIKKIMEHVGPAVDVIVSRTYTLRRE